MRMRGFTLLEVLVAFLIAGLAVGVLLRAGADGLRSTVDAARYQDVLVRAQSRLALAAATPQAGEWEGDDGLYHWAVRAAPLASGQLARTQRRTLQIAQGGAGPAAQITLLAISVTYSWNGHHVTLDSARVAAP